MKEKTVAWPVCCWDRLRPHRHSYFGKCNFFYEFWPFVHTLTALCTMETEHWKDSFWKHRFHFYISKRRTMVILSHSIKYVNLYRLLQQCTVLLFVGCWLAISSVVKATWPFFWLSFLSKTKNKKQKKIIQECYTSNVYLMKWHKHISKLDV